VWLSVSLFSLFFCRLVLLINAVLLMKAIFSGMANKLRISLFKNYGMAVIYKFVLLATL